MKSNFLFMDESFNDEIKPPISSLTGILIPFEQYPKLRSDFYKILRFETQPEENVLNVNPPELHFVDLLRHQNDEIKLDTLWSLTNLVIENGLEIYRVSYFITKEVESTFTKDKRLISLLWSGLLSLLQLRLSTEMVVPVMDAGFERNMKQMTRQFSGTLRTIDVMRETGHEGNIHIKQSRNIYDMFYADSEYSIFTQLVDIVSGLLRISDVAQFKEKLINSQFKKQLLLISENLQKATIHQRTIALNLNGKIQGPSRSAN